MPLPRGKRVVMRKERAHLDAQDGGVELDGRLPLPKAICSYHQDDLESSKKQVSETTEPGEKQSSSSKDLRSSDHAFGA
jgi:hypothetical protein